MTTAAPTIEQPTPVGLLDAVRASRTEQLAEQVRELHLVVEWCVAHEVDADRAAGYVEFGRDTGLALAGAGAPFVSEFAVIELAAALGMTTTPAAATSGRSSRSATGCPASGARSSRAGCRGGAPPASPSTR